MKVGEDQWGGNSIKDICSLVLVIQVCIVVSLQVFWCCKGLAWCQGTVPETT